RRREPLRLPLSNQLTKEVLIHSGALRDGGQPLKRGSKFEDMQPPSRNIEKFAFGLSRYGSSSLRYYELYPEADIVPAEVLLNPGTNSAGTHLKCLFHFPNLRSIPFDPFHSRTSWPQRSLPTWNCTRKSWRP